jgi:hypothetical protein
MSKMFKLFIILILISLIIEFIASAAIIYVASTVFHFQFSWLYVILLFLIIALISK